jgi:hypothetical protein
MVRRQIDLDDESNEILTQLAHDYQGDVGKALGDLLHFRKGVEEFVEACEAANAEMLLTQRERAERGLGQGNFTAWDEIKRRHNL